ncbi:aldehyde dehydrogenase family protein, partial [Fluviicola sp.]|uniref:aldehyde dehydrogenase family protein n=1 Tax=Fluviicola sp. TaxID=1917219 RepID=UPI00345BD4C2
MNRYSGRNHIGYQESALGNHVFFGIDPTTNKPFEMAFHQATAEEVDDALEKAKNAFETYRRISIEKRVLFLKEIANKLRQNKEELIHWF